MGARLSAEARDLLTFTDAEALRALEAITTKRPALVMLERRFAGTPRGAALISRIKADPSLADTMIRVVSSEGGSPGELAGAGIATPPAAATPTRAAHPAPARHGVRLPVTPELDHRGTRRAPRFRIAGAMEVLVDGSRGTIVDLSVYGAQLVTPTVLKPNQRVRITLSDDETTIRCGAVVAWASFEIPKEAGPRYRAGLDFVDQDTVAIEAYARRHREGA